MFTVPLYVGRPNGTLDCEEWSALPLQPFDLGSLKPGQPSEIWGRRQMVDFASLGMNLMETNTYAWDIPISFIEVLMVKTDLGGHLAKELSLLSAPESTTKECMVRDQLRT